MRFRNDCIKGEIFRVITDGNCCDFYPKVNGSKICPKGVVDICPSYSDCEQCTKAGCSWTSQNMCQKNECKSTNDNCQKVNDDASKYRY